MALGGTGEGPELVLPADLPDDENIERASLTDLLQSCDVVSLHLPAPAIAGASLCTPGKTRIPNLLIRSQTAE